MEELLFVVSGDPKGGYVSRAVGEAIFTEADTLDKLREMIRDAVRCHFGAGRQAQAISIRYTLPRDGGVIGHGDGS